jgi:hypothetical protein
MGLKMGLFPMGGALRAALVLAGLSFLGGGAVAAPQEASPMGGGMHHGMSGHGGQMSGHCCGMCPMSKSHKGWLAGRRAQDAELDRLMAAVDAAAPEKKADALAVVVGKLVKERKAAHKKMAAWHAKMREARGQGGSQ